MKTRLIEIISDLSKKSRKKLRKNYKEFVKNRYCLITGLPGPDFHHVRNINGLTGGGITPSDEFGLPLCREMHSELHNIGCKTFQKKYTIDIKKELEKLHNKFVDYMKKNQS